MNKERCCGD